MGAETLSPSLEQNVYVRGFPKQRYLAGTEFVSQTLNNYRYDQPRHILIADIGGFKDNWVLKWLYRDISTVSLNIPEEYHHPKREGDLTYDGFKMPLSSDSIPVVMGIDVLEQVRLENRARLVAEMVRVAKDRVVISCPFHSKFSESEEELLLLEMRKTGLPEKASIKIHRQYGLPKLEELVTMARHTGYPFKILPATNLLMDFIGMHNQIRALIPPEGHNTPTEKQIDRAIQIAQDHDTSLLYAPRPIWEEAYRAVLVIDKKEHDGRILTNENDYFYSSIENTAYGRALSAAGYGNIENPVAFWKEIKLRGLNIAFEGPDGSGKTDTIAKVAELLAQWGYIVATPMRYGPRQRLREMERKNGAIVNINSRETLLAMTTNESIIAANAHILLGPCFIALSDRTLASTSNIYHTMYGTDEGSTFALEGSYQIPPDLTFVLEVDNFEENWNRKSRKGDLANAEISKNELAVQRRLYGELTQNRFTGPLWRIKSNGTVDDTAQKVLDILEYFFGIATRRS